MGKKENPFTYIDNFTRTLAGQLSISADSYAGCESAVEIAKEIRAAKWKSILSSVERQNPSVCGKLAAGGRGESWFVRRDQVACLNDVHEEKYWLDLTDDGEKLLQRIAATALVAEMASNFWVGIIQRGQQTLAESNQDGFRFIVTVVKFTSWKGITFSLYVIDKKTGEGTDAEFFLDKDDPVVIEAGLCHRGDDFISRDRMAAAHALLDTVEVGREVEESASIWLAGQLVLSRYYHGKDGNEWVEDHDSSSE